MKLSSSTLYFLLLYYKLINFSLSKFAHPFQHSILIYYIQFEVGYLSFHVRAFQFEVVVSLLCNFILKACFFNLIWIEFRDNLHEFARIELWACLFRVVTNKPESKADFFSSFPLLTKAAPFSSSFREQ